VDRIPARAIQGEDSPNVFTTLRSSRRSNRGGFREVGVLNWVCAGHGATVEMGAIVVGLGWGDECAPLDRWRRVVI
jgi:hypothetical protein